ncbi:hypothetical protein J5X98_17915 [Leptothermofonsia sichuanensis E412]|jgi:hypothetical protein|uniref:hypothetical protein n=1 Tax=Leptothermofonsia sichuanensis TaxID=2917832 RepID=UPI001CA68673|nr:hypothetical protein [Leptothermofonsia sichuanensis]QZZ19265.1 hypothetical protein J5X98_17915 [Leptothermofonsia sichuanensis E412]
MVHTYEVFVDILEQTDTASHCETTRYEIDAESRKIANDTARHLARNEHPRCTEYDVRVTRLLK